MEGTLFWIDEAVIPTEVSHLMLGNNFQIPSRDISVPNRQNTVPLHLVKWRYRALKFLVHFSSFLLTNVPQKQCKVGILKK